MSLPLAIERQVMAELGRRTALRGSRKRVAHQIGVSEAALSMVLSGKRKPGERIAEGLGFRREWVRVEGVS